MNSEWSCALYLINAKKDLDSLMYWRDNFESISNIDNKSFVDSKRQDFYLNLYNLLDKTKKKKKDDATIRTILDLRNKKYAHDDDSYYENEFETRDELINYMVKQIEYVRKFCASDLPEVVTLDYVSYDRTLFRLINGISPDMEKKLFNKKHPNSSKTKLHSKEYKSFNDVRQIRNIPEGELSNYGVLIEDGLTHLEGLQNRQDSCIKINILYGTNVWCTPDPSIVELMKKLECLGFIDKFGILHIDEMSTEKLEEVMRLFDEFNK